MDARTMKGQKVVVIGAGPVGALAALYAAMRGSEVEVYELRGDLRNPSTAPLNFTKSINLALSERGVNALRHANCPSLLESVRNDTIPMFGRMIHGMNNGKLYEVPQVYDVYQRALGAVDRGGLNKRLLDVLEKMPNVKLFFNHKLTGADFNKNLAWIEKREPGSPSLRDNSKTGSAKRAPEIQISYDLMIGADGAHSAVRYHLMKFARLSYQQEYIDTLWCEFLIPPTAEDDFRLSPNHLHIWPGKDNMFIAIPSTDKTFTSTLFMPASEFTRLDQDPDSLLNFFKTKFPGVVPSLISEKDLLRQYLDNPHLPLISIKCTPYHYKSSVVIIGDAAHAMVPFYGQGMNAGFEDVRILFNFLDKNIQVENDNESDAKLITEDRAKALSAYTTYRTPDAAAIIDLALRNYQEMRSDVQSPFYRLRKWTEETLAYYIPSLGWATQYSRISFGNERYSKVIETSRRQLRMLQSGLTVSMIAGLGIGILLLRRYTWLKRLTKLFVRPVQYVEYSRYWLRRGGS